MKLRSFPLVLLSSVFLPVVVVSEDNLQQQTTQLYWKLKGDEELVKALNRTRNDGIAKNIIIFVGDGMGPNTITASRIYKSGESGQLEFEKFPNTGLLKTYSVDRTVPDSACTATALFTGVKTNYEVTGLDAGVNLQDCPASLKKEHRVSSIIDWAQAAGKDTGFVTTTRVTHATPSALYSHSADRKWECEANMPPSAARCKDIARQLIEDEPGRNIKVIMGGGRQCLTWNITDKPNDQIDQWACIRKDGRDLIKQWITDKKDRKLIYQVLTNTRDLSSINYNNADYVLGIFANGHMSFEDLRDKTPNGAPSLKQMTSTAIKLLRRKKTGYVLVVEGGLIDIAHHRGYARRALEETVMFNEAIAEAVSLTGDDTLIIVTSDHSHNLNINGLSPIRNDILGIAMNSKIDGVPYTTLTYSTGGPKNYQYEVISNTVHRKDPTASNYTSYSYHQQAGILNDESTHGGVDVPVFAKGPMSHLFHGVHEQSYVAHVMAYAAKIGRFTERADPPSSCHRSSQSSIGAVGSTTTRLIAVIFFIFSFFYF